MATLTGAIIQAVKDSGAVGGRVWRRTQAPGEVDTWPYVTVMHPVNSDITFMGDSSVLGRGNDAQVDLWQERGDEDDTIRLTIVSALDGVNLGSTDDGYAFRCRVVAEAQEYEEKPRIIHDIILLRIDRLVGAAL